MVEESPETFVSRWRAFAADVEMFAHTEGSPLLECRVADAVLQLFERTGPYLSRPGPAKVIINPAALALEPVTEPGALRGIESHGLSNITAVGTVVARDGRVVVLDAGAPLVVVVTGEAPQVAPGDLVRMVSDGPVHGFVVSHERAYSRPRSEAVDETI